MNAASAYAKEVAHAVTRRYPDEKIMVIGHPWPDLLDSLGDRLEAVVDDKADRLDEISKRTPNVKTVLSPDFSLNEVKDFSSVLVINSIAGELKDIWALFRNLRTGITRDHQCVLVEAPYFWQPFISLIRKLRTGKKTPPRSWLSRIDIENLLELNGFEIVSTENRLLFPFQIPVLTRLFNHFLVSLPLIRFFSIMRVYFLRQKPSWMPKDQSTEGPTVSVIVPCKDEKDNIERCINEMPVMGPQTEVVFVEGGSTDGTPEEIERVISNYQGPLKIRSVKQTEADGKGGAVRIGFDAAEEDILMILDSDLTVPASELPKFYLALAEGHGDMIMGSRLVYPLEKQAMRTLNIFGNKFFSLLFTWILDRPIKDTLCGTKVLRKHHYEIIKSRRHIFGSFDPFGDYDLLFGAALQNFKVVEIPVRYQARTYGSTKISRFTHGWLLLKMCLFAFRHFKLG